MQMLCDDGERWYVLVSCDCASSLLVQLLGKLADALLLLLGLLIVRDGLDERNVISFSMPIAVPKRSLEMISLQRWTSIRPSRSRGPALPGV